MIPFEALLPYAVIIGMFGVAGGGMTLFNSIKTDNHRRMHPDKWDYLMMERDVRLTGKYMKQDDTIKAPESFKTSSAWRINRSWDD
ncbi:putative NIMM subunit of mitochondrial NADH:ubiquinone oxidoreductase [Dipodascopsis uninucleata]